MDAIKQDPVMRELAEMHAKLETLSDAVTYLADKQRQRDELFGEMQPIVKEVMGHATGKLQGLEDRGYFTFLKESARVLDRIVESYDEDDLRALGDNIVRIMDTVRAYTQPRMLAIANDATEAIEKADELEPTGVFGMVRASRDEDVQRGMAVFLAVLRAVGRGVKELGDEPTQPKRLAAAPAQAPAKPAPHKPPTKVTPITAAAKAPPVMLDGAAFDESGYLADPSHWTPELAAAIAAAQGIATLTDRHWAAIQAARADFLEHGASPNIRRLTTISDVTTKELYQLFPKAPGMTLARVAGIPKPAGCI